MHYVTNMSLRVPPKAPFPHTSQAPLPYREERDQGVKRNQIISRWLIIPLNALPWMARLEVRIAKSHDKDVREISYEKIAESHDMDVSQDFTPQIDYIKGGVYAS